MLPNGRLIARVFHHVPVNAATRTSISVRGLSTSASQQAWEGRKPEEQPAREADKHNVQHDASREGKKERAAPPGEGSRGTQEGAGKSNEKAKEEFPEAPDTIGMQDERGGKQ